MAGTILTPVAIWRDFDIKSSPSATVISQTKSGSINYTELTIDGRALSDGAVKIYARLAKGKGVVQAPAILLLGDFNRSCKTLQDDLVKKGYIVMTVDIEGKVEGKERYTEYPQSISYANYEDVKSTLYEVLDNVDKTCWYEWTAVMRYALAYLKNVDGVTKVGGLGIGEACTVMWQVAGTDDNLDCACFALNAGWNGYRGIYKFAGMVEPQFSNSSYKFIAGVEPQSYAMHVKCPTLMLCATNSDEFDVDRAYDTVSRIDEQYFRAVHYSVGQTDSVNNEGYQDAILFLDGFLKSKTKPKFPAEMDIKCEIEKGVIIIEVKPDKKNLTGVELYVSEQTTRPSLRAWRKITEYKEKTAKGVYIFEYSPYPESGMITAFASASYESGFTLGSTIISKKFNANEVLAGHKSNIIYSSRLPNAQTTFTLAQERTAGFEQICAQENKCVKVKKGPMSIEGVYGLGGLVTFKVNSLKDSPKPDAILMFDAHAKTDINLTVKLSVDYFGNRVDYLATVKVFGGHIWHNFILPRNKFKTAEGMVLKSYENVCAISFTSDDEFLLNNALWV